MEQITFSATATFSKEQVSSFAKANGWLESGDLSAENYAKEVIKKEIVKFISRHEIDAIVKNHEDNRNNEISQYKEELNQSITVEEI